VNEYDEERTVILSSVRENLRNARTGVVVPPGGAITLKPGDLVILLP